MLNVILMLEVGEGTRRAPLSITSPVINSRNHAVQFIRWSTHSSWSLSPLSIWALHWPRFLTPMKTNSFWPVCGFGEGVKVKHFRVHLVPLVWASALGRYWRHKESYHKPAYEVSCWVTTVSFSVSSSASVFTTPVSWPPLLFLPISLLRVSLFLDTFSLLLFSSFYKQYFLKEKTKFLLFSSNCILIFPSWVI